MALVNSEAGVTRDWQHSEGWLAGIPLQVFDTAGFEDVMRRDKRDGGRRSAAEVASEARLPGRFLSDDLKNQILSMTEDVVTRSHVVLLVLDAKDGVTPDDEHFARWLRSRAGEGIEGGSSSSNASSPTGTNVAAKQHVPVVVVANKCEAFDSVTGALDDMEGLGLGEPIAISASHGEGMGDLHAALIQVGALIEAKTGHNPARDIEQDVTKTPKSADEKLRLAIVGRPNVGKSTLLNTLSGTSRSLASALPGTTRNVVNVTLSPTRSAELASRGRKRRPPATDAKGEVDDAEATSSEADTTASIHVELTDTAGIRRVKSVLRNESEAYGAVDTAAMAQALDAIRRAHVTCLLVDSTGADIGEDEALSLVHSRDAEVRRLTADSVLTTHDIRIAEYAAQEGRPLMMLLNKWDQINPTARKALKRACKKLYTDGLGQGLKGIPLIATNSLEQDSLRDVIPTAQRLFERWTDRISTGRLNRWLRAITQYKPPPNIHGRAINIKYMTQVTTRPPTFAIFTPRAASLPKTYERFLVNSLREEFNLEGVPLRVNFRARENPYLSGGERASKANYNTKKGLKKKKRKRPWRDGKTMR